MSFRDMSPRTPDPFSFDPSIGKTMMLSSLLTISALAGLGFATTSNEYRLACKAVEAAISNMSNVYYPGDSSGRREASLRKRR